MHHLLILCPEAQEYSQLLADYQLPELTIHLADQLPLEASYLESIDLVLGDPPWIAQVLDQLPSLKWVQSTFAGVNALCQAHLRQDYQLTNVKGVFGQLMSEYVFGYLINLERDFFRAKQQQAQHQWQSYPARSLAGRCIGIAGLGDIGQHLALTAKHFAMQVHGLKLNPSSLPNVDKVYTLANLREFLSDLDYLVITLPATPQTRYLFNAESLSYLKPNAILVNVGRGTCIDEAALVTALTTKHIKAAVLDVFAEEPLAKTSPLWDLENAYITPHQAAVSFPKSIVPIFVDNYSRFHQGQALNYQVNLQRGY